MTLTRMRIDLTDEQQEQIEPLIDEVWQAYNDGQPVILAAQIGWNGDFDYMNVGIIPHDKATEIERLLSLYNLEENTDESD